MTSQDAGSAATSIVGPAALEVDGRPLHVQARRADGLGDVHPLQEPPRHERDRTRQADGAGASDDEPRLSGLEHERRGHHAREPVAGLLRPPADDVELSEHVVQLRPAAEDARPRAQRGRQAGGEPVRVDDGDVRGARERSRPERPVGVRDGARLRFERRLPAVCVEELEDPPDDRASLRRQRAQLAPEKRELERLLLEDAVAAQVVHELREQLDEHRRPGVADAFEGVADVGRPNARRIAVDAASSLVSLEDPLEDRVQEQALLVALEPVARERDRRVDEHPPLPGREAFVDELEPCEQSGDRDGSLADVEHLRTRVPEVDEQLLHLPEARLRDPEEAVEHRRRATRLVHESEAAPCRPGQRPFGHEGGERRGEERIDGVAALAEDAGAGLGRQRMTGCDGASHPERLLRERP